MSHINFPYANELDYSTIGLIDFLETFLFHSELKSMQLNYYECLHCEIIISLSSWSFKEVILISSNRINYSKFVCVIEIYRSLIDLSQLHQFVINYSLAIINVKSIDYSLYEVNFLFTEKNSLDLNFLIHQ